MDKEKLLKQAKAISDRCALADTSDLSKAYDLISDVLYCIVGMASNVVWDAQPEVDVQPPRDIEEFSTRDLLDELMKRHEHAVFAGMLFREGNTLVRSRELKGNLITCSGLAQWISNFAIDQDNKDCREFDGEA